MRPSGVIVYQRVADELAGEITTGKLEKGSQLPTEPELSARFSVNRHTLRRAISVLAEMGLVNVEHGRGTFVTNGMINYPVGRRTRFTEIISRQNLSPHATFLHSAIVLAKSRLAEDLRIEISTPCLLIEMLRSVSGTPVTLASHYFVEARFSGLDSKVEELGSLSRALESYGVAEYTRKVTRVSARNATKEEAKLLRQAPSKPVLVSETVNIDPDGVPIEHTVGRSACDRLQMVFDT